MYTTDGATWLTVDGCCAVSVPAMGLNLSLIESMRKFPDKFSDLPWICGIRTITEAYLIPAFKQMYMVISLCRNTHPCDTIVLKAVWDKAIHQVCRCTQTRMEKISNYAVVYLFRSDGHSMHC